MPMNRHMFNAIFNPGALAASVKMERVQLQAKAAGVEKQFEFLMRAEQYRARNFPGAAMDPNELLQITVATAFDGDV